MEWTQEESVNYECAVECIGDMISIRTAALAQEREAPYPDQARVAQLLAEVSQLGQERQDLSLHDHEHVARILREYGAQVRAEFERTRSQLLAATV